MADQTTEERIAQIAQGFGQGINNYRQGQQAQQSQQMQQEALKRQRAMQALQISNQISEQTGRQADFGQVAQALDTNDFSGLNGLMNSAPLTRKAGLEQQDRQLKSDSFALDKELKQSQINKNNRAGNSGQNLTYEEKLNLKLQKEAEAKAREQASPDFRLEKLGVEGRSKVGALASGLQALDQMEKSSLDGHGPQYLDANTSIIGGLVSDTPYSEGERTVSEVIGRLQSGGAMSENEVNTFRALGPRPGDDAGTRKRKLGQQRDFLNNKLTAFSMKNDDLDTLGFKTVSDYRPRVQEKTETAVNAPKKGTVESGYIFLGGDPSDKANWKKDS